MDLNQLQLYPRVRNHWSAVDMGIRLARQWYWDLFWGWFLGAWIVLLVFSLGFFWEPWVIYAGFWWCKPLLDRLPLYIGSRRMFGQRMTLREAWRSGRPHLRRDFFALLTWRRFSPSRSFDQPVTVLENLTGARRQRRLQQLHRAGFAQSCWLTWVCCILEAVGALAVYAFVAMMIPESYQIGFQTLLSAEGAAAEIFSSVITLLVASAIAPFYVMGGFLLYLNRRIALEGWDIELQFRALAQRLAQQDSQMSRDVVGGTGGDRMSQRASARGTVAVLPWLVWLSVSLLSFGLAQPALALHSDDSQRITPQMMEIAADIVPQPDSERTKIRELVAKVLSAETFHTKEMQGEWQPRNAPEEAPVVYPQWMIEFVEFLENLGILDEEEEDPEGSIGDILFVANALEFLLWVALFLVIGIVLYRYRRVLLSLVGEVSQRPITERRRPAAQIQGLDIRPETLPTDIPAEVRGLFAVGESRQALALLYRASLSRLAHRWHVPFAGHHTEMECLQLVRTQLEKAALESEQSTMPVTSIFKVVVALWTQCAYGHKVPDVRQLECTLTHWPKVFDGE